MALITWLDIVLGARVSLNTFHWAPIALVAWTAGAWPGYACVAVSVAMGGLRTIIEGGHPDYASLVWDIAARALSYCVLVWVLDRLRAEYAKEAERRRASQEAARLKSSKLLLMRHEIANAVTVLKMWAFLSNGGNRDRADRAAEGWAAISRVLHDVELAAGAGADSENLLVKLERVDLAKLLPDLVEIYQPLCAQQSLTLVLAAAQGGLVVWADRAGLSLALSILIGNAVKHTPEKGRLTIKAEPHAQDRGRVRVSVTDTGVGIAPVELKRIDAAMRLHKNDPAAGSLGRGLKTVRDLLFSHDSRLEIDSEPGRGSRFSFDLTVASDAPVENLLV